MDYSFQIERFKQNFSKGGARPNLFRVVVGGIEDKLTFTCRAASIPAQTLGTIEVPYFGRKVKVAGDRTFAEWSITVLNDEDWKVRREFEQWNHLINTHNENLREGPYDIVGGMAGSGSGFSYKRDAQVYHFDKSGNKLGVYRFFGIYPSEIGAIDLAWDTTDTIEEFTVTLQYDYWLTDQEDKVTQAKIDR